MFYLGLDLGQKKDHSAIAIVERWDGGLPFRMAEMRRLEVRYLERVPLGTPYTAVAARVARLVQDHQMSGQCAAVVDATGVGAPVVDLLRASRLGCEVMAVSITGGERVSRNGLVWNVPKRDLIAGVQVLLEHGELRIAKRLRDSWPLVKELVDVRMTRSDTNRVRLGADGSGEHDDLAIAVALACWRAQQRGIGFGRGRLPGI